MGYSCTREAANMLGVIEHVCKNPNDNSHTIQLGENVYFFERGREQGDGAITGSLMLMLPDDYCRKVGSVRIAPDGSIVKFPHMSKVVREECENTFRDMQARNPQLMRAWSTGVL